MEGAEALSADRAAAKLSDARSAHPSERRRHELAGRLTTQMGGEVVENAIAFLGLQFGYRLLFDHSLQGVLPFIAGQTLLRHEPQGIARLAGVEHVLLAIPRRKAAKRGHQAERRIHGVLRSRDPAVSRQDSPDVAAGFPAAGAIGLAAASSDHEDIWTM